MNINERPQPAAWLIALISACIVAAPYWILLALRQTIPLDIRLDRGVLVAAMIGVPVAAVVWRGFQRYLAQLSTWRLIAMAFLLMAFVYIGQIGARLLLSRVLLHMLDLGMSKTEMAPIYVVLTNIEMAGMAILTSLAVTWGFLGRSPARPIDSFVNASYTFGLFAAFSFGVFVYVDWLETRLPFMDLSDFIPREYVTLSKLSLAMLFAMGVTLLLRRTFLRRESFPMVVVVPWAMLAAAMSLRESGWFVAQFVEGKVQIHHVISNFALGVLFCFVLCAIPLVVQARYGTVAGSG